jgi:FkbM family methyltransferase
MNCFNGHKFRLTQHLMDSGFFQQIPMRIVDAGARGGSEPHWDIYGDQVHLIGFEPDAKECVRLNQSAKLWRRESYYPIALYRNKGTHTLYITQNPLASSLLKPNPDFVDRFPQSALGAVVATTQIQTTDIDSFMEENNLDYVDFMKIDVEGAELALLEGASRLLSDSLLGLSIEVFFQPYRIGEPLFADVDQYLRRFGFVLFDLVPERWRRKTLATKNPMSWYGAGQLVWAQALYLRDLAAEMMSASYKPINNARIKVLKLASLAEVFDVPDFAIELLENGCNKGLLSHEETALMINLMKRTYTEKSKAQYGLRGGYISLIGACVRFKRWLKELLSE